MRLLASILAAPEAEGGCYLPLATAAVRDAAVVDYFPLVSALSLANAGGRVGWAAVSDSIGCKNTMYALGFCLPACLAVPQITSMAVGTTATTPRWAFYGTTFAIVSA